MKISELVMSTILKKGVLYEAKNCDLEFDIPMTQSDGSIADLLYKTRIKIKAESITIKVEKPSIKEGEA